MNSAFFEHFGAGETLQQKIDGLAEWKTALPQITVTKPTPYTPSILDAGNALILAATLNQGREAAEGLARTQTQMAKFKYE